MSQFLVALLGNDQQLKDSIFEKFTQSESLNQQIQLPYSFLISQTVTQDSYYVFNVLNTPSTIDQEDLIYMWDDLMKISKLENCDQGTVIYCFKDYENNIVDILNKMHIKIGCQYSENALIILTQSKAFLNQIQMCKQNNLKNLSVLQVDQVNPQLIFRLIDQNKYLHYNSLKPLSIQNLQQEQILNEQYIIILQSWKEMIQESKNKANFIKSILQTQIFDDLSKKITLNFMSMVSMFNFIVNLRQLLVERIDSFIDKSVFQSLEASKFYYCKSNKCMMLQEYYSVLQQNPIVSINIALQSYVSTTRKCCNCSQRTKYLKFDQIIDSVFDEFCFNIIKKISLKQQQQKGQRTLQVMFLSNDNQEKKQVFNAICENSSSNDPKIQYNFLKSQIINENYIFHDSPLFNLVEDRDQTILRFGEYFQKNEIHFFLIFVSYQRIDIMIQRIQNLIKFIHCLDRKKMALIVNSCVCVKQQQLDMEQNLTYFGFKSIKFLHQSDSLQDVKKKIFECLENSDSRKFDFKNTIFELADESITNQLQENLTNASKLIEEEQQNLLKTHLDQENEYIKKEKIEIQDMEDLLKSKKAQLKYRENTYQQDLKKLETWKKNSIRTQYNK